MKTILPDAESHEEHDATKYSPIRQMMAKLGAFLCLRVVESQKGMKIEKNKAF